MSRFRTLFTIATGAAICFACARYAESSAAGTVIDASEAAKTVVLNVDNSNSQPMELHASVNGRSYFVGSVGGSDSTSILLDPALFPTGFLYLTAIPADGRGRAVAGPMVAAKGDKIRFKVLPALEMSHAIVIR